VQRRTAAETRNLGDRMYAKRIIMIKSFKGTFKCKAKPEPSVDAMLIVSNVSLISNRIDA